MKRESNRESLFAYLSHTQIPNNSIKQDSNSLWTVIEQAMHTPNHISSPLQPFQPKNPTLRVLTLDNLTSLQSPTLPAIFPYPPLPPPQPAKLHAGTIQSSNKPSGPSSCNFHPRSWTRHTCCRRADRSGLHKRARFRSTNTTGCTERRALLAGRPCLLDC